jgi:hypothetical protein
MLFTRIIQITFTSGFIALFIYMGVVFKREGFIREDTTETEN